MIRKANTDIRIPCYFRKVERSEIDDHKYNPHGGWQFRWSKPTTQGFDVFGLVVDEYPSDVQGLIALRPNYDDAFRCVDVEILESAPWNKKYQNKKLNPNRLYQDVGFALVAFACQYSIDKELEGFVELTSKSSKFDFYLKLGARPAFGQNMTFSDKAAQKIVQEFFPGGVTWWQNK
ncbi:hypothetical protein ACFQ88_22805 [Paenibacillus sp. NPDC056579]|uniref:hypothetical protein n=1 Tax=Paenibacillus sp. NPDC056579 TaxID=3345871 RepID=UPI003694BBAC